jgi:hypothetical protein
MEDGLGNSITWLMDYHSKQCLNTKSCNKSIANRCPIHLVIKIILVDLDYELTFKCGIRDIYIMAMSYPTSNLHHFFSISINLNMPYKIKLIMSNATTCCNA